ncbi:hypothetical protein V8E52_002605 [Russula decolorans]
MAALAAPDTVGILQYNPIQSAILRDLIVCLQCTLSAQIGGNIPAKPFMTLGHIDGYPYPSLRGIVWISCDQLSGKPVGNQIATSLFVRMDQLSNYSMAQNIHSILGSHNQKIVAEITQLAHPCKCHSNPELEQEAYPTRGKQKKSSKLDKYPQKKDVSIRYYGTVYGKVRGASEGLRVRKGKRSEEATKAVLG